MAVGGHGMWQGDYGSMFESSVVCTCTYVYAMQCVRFCMCVCVCMHVSVHVRAQESAYRCTAWTTCLTMLRAQGPLEQCQGCPTNTPRSRQSGTPQWPKLDKRTHTHMVSNHIVWATSPEVLSLYNLETSFMHQSPIKTMQLMILATFWQQPHLNWVTMTA